VTLLEEPQAAFYAWIDHNGAAWREKVKVGDVVLICDVGGGTSDFSLIAIGEETGRLVLTRVAVGDHILLGGDNMDLKLAYVMSQGFAARTIKLAAGQMLMLRHACRDAKERLFADPSLAVAPVTIMGRGSKVIAGSIKGELTRDDLQREILDGFFPECGADEVPRQARIVGFQEVGLPYAAEAAVTKHLAYFLSRHRDDLAQHTGGAPPPAAAPFHR